MEDMFGIIKQNMQYDKFRRRGLDKADIEMCLIFLGHLLRELFAFYGGNARFDYLVTLADLQSETITNRRRKEVYKKKGVNESARKKCRKRKKVS